MAPILDALSKYNTVDEERNKRRKGDGAVGNKDNNKNLQTPGQHQVRQTILFLQMVNI